MAGKKTGTIPLTIYEVTLTKLEIESLPTTHRQFLFASCAAANDIAASWRLLILAVPSSEDEVTKQISVLAYLRAARRLIADCHEFRPVVSRFLKGIARSPLDENIRSECRDFLAFRSDAKLLKHASAIRQDVTNHYSGPALDRHFSHFPDDHPFKIFMHRMVGNSAYVFAEEIAVFGSTRAEPGRDIDDLIEWATMVSGRAMEFHQKVLNLIIERYFPVKVGDEIVVAVEERFIFDKEDALPLFFRPRPD